MILAFFLSMQLISLKLWAYQFDFNAFYYSDSNKLDVEDSNNRTNFDLFIGLDLDKKGQYVVGWNYNSISISEKDGSDESTFASSDMGPKFLAYLNKDLNWSLSVAYSLNAVASYKSPSSSTEVELRGTSILASLGYITKLGDNLCIGANINYYAGSYDEQFDSSDNFSKVSYSQNEIYPSVVLSYRVK